MGLFTRIKDAIFGSPEEAGRAPDPAPRSATAHPTGTGSTPAPSVEREPRPVIDIENNLDNMPGADSLNWRTSIVDLMKLLGIDSDHESRHALAAELGRENYTGTAEDNQWLHRRVMTELANHGGKVPAEFLD